MARKKNRHKKIFQRRKKKFTFKKTILKNYNDKKNDFKILLERYGLNEKFPKKLEQEAQKIEQKYQTEKEKIFQQRKDLRKNFIITIDGEDAKDFDDAISVEEIAQGFLLGVHIADVSFFIKEKSSLDKEAYLRGNSFYLLDRVLPMLPEKISNVLCSLQEKKERLTLSCFLKIDKEGNILDFFFKKSIIKSNHRYTYSQVEKILNNSLKTSKQEKSFFSIAWKLATILKETRKKQGSIFFQSREFNCQLKNDEVLFIKKKNSLKSENLIEEFMLVANQCAAKFLKENKIITLHRIHPKPSDKKIIPFQKMLADKNFNFSFDKKKLKAKNKFQFFLEQLKITEKETYHHGDFLPSIYHSLLLNGMSKAEYSVSPSIHYGLGFKDYCHFTSPIRRYPDLLVHRGIVQLLEKQSCKKITRREAKWLSSKESQAMNCEREYFKLKVLRYLKNHLNKRMTVCIKNIYPDIVFAEEINYGIYGELKGDFHNYIFDTTRYLDKNDKTVYQLGTVLKVFIQKIDIINLKIVYSL